MIYELRYPEGIFSHKWFATLSWSRHFRMMFFCWPGYSKFVFHREETLNKLANLMREVIAKKRIEFSEEDSDNEQTLVDMITTRNGFGKILFLEVSMS